MEQGGWEGVCGADQASGGRVGTISEGRVMGPLKLDAISVCGVIALLVLSWWALASSYDRGEAAADLRGHAKWADQ